LGIAHSFTFKTHPAPDTVVYYELSLLPRALPSSEEAVERATNLFLAFQEYGRIAPARLGMSWHVTPEPDGRGGFGTKVEILGQWMGSEEEYEVVIKEFEEVVKRRGVGEFNRGQRSLSECCELILTEPNQPIYSRCSMLAEIGRRYRREGPSTSTSMSISTPRYVLVSSIREVNAIDVI
jgi:hypothetical protein